MPLPLLQLLTRPPAAAQGPPLPARPLLRPGHRVVADGPRLLLERGHRVVLLEGRAAAALLPRLLPLLDGSRTVAEIAVALGPQAGPAVEHALRVLAARRLLCEGPSPELLPRPLRDTVELLAADSDLPPALVAERLGSSSVCVVGASAVAAAAVELVAAAGVAVVRARRWRDARGDVVIAAPAPAEAGAIRRLNRRSLRRGVDWLPVLPYDGRIAAVGPLIVPRETACATCYLLRRAAAVDYGEELPILERAPVRIRSVAALDRLAAEIAVLHVLRWLGTRDARLPGTLQTVELGDGVEILRHVVLRVPRCPSCSGLGAVAPPLPWHDLPLEAA